MNDGVLSPLIFVYLALTYIPTFFPFLFCFFPLPSLVVVISHNGPVLSVNLKTRKHAFPVGPPDNSVLLFKKSVIFVS